MSICYVFFYIERHIVECLGEYLTHTNASPLQKALVEVKTPFAGSVEFDEEPFKVQVYTLGETAY